MRKSLVILIMCLTSSAIYAADYNSYLSVTGGTGSGFLMSDKHRSDFLYSQQMFGGGSFQRPIKGNLLFDVALLWHGKAKEIPSEYFSIQDVTHTGSVEATLKYNFMRVNIIESIQPKIYIKGGLAGSLARIYYDDKENKRYLGTVGPLVGIGAQLKCFSRGLVDVSYNQCFSVTAGSNNPWYIRGGIGYRL